MTTTLFPPLAQIPAGPKLGVDPRQNRTRRILNNIGDAMGASPGPVPVRGYFASAVDVGAVQAALEQGLARFNEERLASRWEEIFGWIADFLRAWIQRCKEMMIERRGPAVRIEIVTQDDLGYYNYGFDIFPARAKRA
jgi:hypothetical protein